MKFDEELLDPEIRNISGLGKILPYIYSRRGCKLFNKILKLSLVGKCVNKDLAYEQRWIRRKDGSKLRICIYRPSETKTDVPGLLWIHGGGYAIGAPELDEVFIQKFIEKSHCVVVTPDYRCSVDEPYPAALEDCYTALLWMKHNADKLGIRSNQLFVGGDSAGGGLTAALSLYARDRETVNIAFQIPLYPMIDDRMNTESAMNNYAPVWNSKLNYKGWKYYLAEDFMTSKVSKYAAPARETDYSNLPPTCTFVGYLEPFRDETIKYIENLKAAGVDTYFQVYDRCYHGFDQLSPESKVAKEATEFLMNTFMYAVENYFADQPSAK
ncbi:MAG: alpha/beta hydrolase [Clostridium sp.]|nr:alpha/beta hydrolase [Clostridium sp.]